MVTIESERQYVLKAITLGVDDFIVKPFSEATIVAKLDAIWNRLQKTPDMNTFKAVQNFIRTRFNKH